MKKAVVIVGILVVLALVAVPVLAGVLVKDGGPDHQMAPQAPPGLYGQSGEGLDRQMVPRTDGFGRVFCSPAGDHICPPPGNLRKAQAPPPQELAGGGGGFRQA